MFCLPLESDKKAIFVIPMVDLHNRILISSQNSDLEKSASSTARPKTLEAPRAASKSAMKLQFGM